MPNHFQFAQFRVRQINLEKKECYYNYREKIKLFLYLSSLQASERSELFTVILIPGVA